MEKVAVNDFVRRQIEGSGKTYSTTLSFEDVARDAQIQMGNGKFEEGYRDGVRIIKGSDEFANQFVCPFVRIDENNLIRVAGRLTDIEGVRASVERAVAQDPGISVIVQAHPQARNQLVIHSVDQSRSAGVLNVGFAVDG